MKQPFARSGARPIVAVFAKAPRPGLVKTRMTPPLSPEEAATLYRCMLDDVLHATAAMAGALGLEPWLLVHPPDAAAELADHAPATYRVVAQRGADLASRMGWAVRECGATGAPFVLLRGSDSPALPRRCIEQAISALRTSDVVVSPDADGGYNLVGLRSGVPAVFDHEMSTSNVLADTLASAHAAGLRTRVLADTFDLDSALDLARLAHLSSDDAALCRRTLTYVSETTSLPNISLVRGRTP